MNLPSRYLSNWRAFGFLVAIVLLFAQPACAQGSASVAPANLNHLVDNAQIIVRGNVLSAVLEPHPQFANLQTVVVTFSVAKIFKGQATPTLTFRQFVWDTKDATGSGGYHKSEELLLFLNPTSLYGLTSPVGMEQGRFRVLHDDLGYRFAVNGRGNVGLFADVVTKSTERGVTFSPQARSMLSKNGGQVSLGTLEETIQVLVAARP